MNRSNPQWNRCNEIALFEATNGTWTEAPMSPGSEFEEFARDCARLATQANSPELRERLIDIAREWMRAAMDAEDAPGTTPRSQRNTRQARR
jgi:hypothetical protein